VGEYWYPRLYSRVKKSEDFWNLELLGKRDLAGVAREKAKDILGTHQPEPLEKDVQKGIHTILSKAEKRALR